MKNELLIHEQRRKGDDLEATLARCVRSYLRTCDSGDACAQADALLWTSTALARLLGRLLEGSDGWSRWYSVDDVLPTSVAVLSAVELRIEGMMIWGEHKTTCQWVEPFFVSVRVSETSDSIVAYRIMCGDATPGLGTIPP